MVTKVKTLVRDARVALWRSRVGPLWRWGKNRVQRLLYRGDRVECPVCGARYRAFLPLTTPFFRDNVRCLTCDSRERHRMLWLYLRDELKLSSRGGRILHVAPEPALTERLRAFPAVHHLSFDLHSPLADVRGDLTRLPFADHSFDGILCVHVLDYIVDDRAAMRELRRVLKPGGWAIVQIPIDLSRAETDEDVTVTDPAEQLRRFRLEGHYRVYGRDYPARLEAAGFQVTVRPYATELGELAARYALPEDEPVFLCQ